MFNAKTSLKSLLKNPAFVILGVSLGVLVLQILVIGRLRPFNSDDLYWQQAVRTWMPFSGDIFYFGTNDIFVALGPFFAVLERVFGSSRRLLTAESVLLTTASFTLFYVSSLYFLRKLHIKLTYPTLFPFLWLASFGYPLVQNYLNTDWRTFQIGFSFATYALVAAYINKDLEPLRGIRSKVLTGIAILFTGALMCGDPYYTYFTIGPLALFAGYLFLLRKINRPQLATIAGGVALSFVVSKIIAWLCVSAGMRIMAETPAAFVNFEDILTNIVTSVHGLLIMFGADFFGRPIASVATFGFALHALLLGIILYVAVSLGRTLRPEYVRRANPAQTWPAFLAGTMAIIFIVYTSSTLVMIKNAHFYVMFVYCAVALFAIALGLCKSRVARLAAGWLLMAATIFNVGYTAFSEYSVRGQFDVGPNVSNSVNYALIRAVEAEGLTKGYTGYWQANVDSYLSDNRVAFLPSLCASSGETIKFRWLRDSAQFDRKATRSFYLMDMDPFPPWLCSREQLDVQFGPPQKVVEVGLKTMLIYDYDITSRLR